MTTERARALSTAERWERFFHWGPYGLLALSIVMSAATTSIFMSVVEIYVAGALLVAAVALQLWWGWTRSRQPEPAPAARAYYVVRTVLAFVLTWLNPFFAIYALIGYFDAQKLLTGRWVRPGLFATAVTMAGSQSGGLPPVSATQWLVFGALYAVNTGLGLIFGHLGAKEAEEAAAKAATIAELERANARLEQALAENAGLHAQLLVQAREAGVNDERRRLAAEIHDTIAQGLAGIITQLQAVTAAEDPEAAREHLARAQALARQSLGEARRSVHNLSPAELAHDALHEAMKKTVAEWGVQEGVRAEFTVTGMVEPLHDEIEATLLRIAQEALTNAARHARATRVGVTLSYMDGEVTLDVRDDGCGFDRAALPPRTVSGGFGLGGLRARTERLAGTVDIESEPGQGTAVSARVPLVRHA
ncbi:sensor histidine kinase [Streptomyces sp. NPDC050636]|uniref:sensor histidine kinase n=1 Tax=Streptomyces sp. NPDC050636 TaxID=3154510 RepID=UPI00343FFE00